MDNTQHKALKALMVRELDRITRDSWGSYEEACKVTQGVLEAFFPDVTVTSEGKETDETQHLLCVTSLHPKVALIKAERHSSLDYQGKDCFRVGIEDDWCGSDPFEEVVDLFDKAHLGPHQD